MSDVKVIDEKEVDLEKDMNGVTEIFDLNLSKSISVPSSSYKSASIYQINKYGCVPPPYKSSEILLYKKLDSTYQACLDVRANTLVGLGYELKDKRSDSSSPIQRFLNHPNKHIGETFSMILKNMFNDLDTFYNGYIEFVKSGDIRALYYVPAKDIYIKPKVDRAGHSTRNVDKYMKIERGFAIEYQPYPFDGKTKDGVHYLLHFKRNSQESVLYGQPDNAHLHDLIKQSYLSDQYNINFFSNGGQPSWAVLITGGKLSKRGQEKIREFIDSHLKGVTNAHKMLFLSVPQEKAEIKLVPLSKSIDEQFISLNEKTRFQIALKMHVLPKMLGISSGGNFGGGSAGIADLQLFIETVARAEQQYIEDVLNRFFELEFGYNPEFTLHNMNISNEKDKSIIANLYWNMVDEYGNRVLGINEIRTKYLQLKPIDLIQTAQDESKLDDNTKVNVNIDGDIRTNNNDQLGTGNKGDIENLNPDKNKR